MNLPTIKQLRYFQALTEEMHFGRAARSCFVSQSAFSAAIKQLEMTLNAGLVDRTNRQVTITPVGHSVAIQARETLMALEHMAQSVAGPVEPLTGKLRLGVIPTIAPFLLPHVLPKLRRAYPKLELFLTEAQTAALHDKTLSGDIDVALLALPFDLPATQLMPLFKDQFMLACREGSRHVDPGHYSFDRLATGSVMLMEDGHCLRDHALDACRLRDPEKLNRFKASTLLSLVEMVDADMAITYLPELAANSTLLRNTKVRLHPLDAKNYRTIGLAWHKGSSRADEFRMLGNFIRKAANR